MKIDQLGEPFDYVVMETSPEAIEKSKSFLRVAMKYPGVDVMVMRKIGFNSGVMKFHVHTHGIRRNFLFRLYILAAWNLMTRMFRNRGNYDTIWIFVYEMNEEKA